MSDIEKPSAKREKHDRHHAKKRRERRDAARGGPAPRRRPKIAREENATLFIYGFHTVEQALKNPARVKRVLHVSTNALSRLETEFGVNPRAIDGLEIIECHPRELDKLVGSEAVHQGVVLHVDPLTPKPFSEMGDSNLVLVLDQVTDPHNVGAIIRSAVAMNAGAVITTSRYSPVETGVLAKAASGGQDLIDHVEVRNLAECLEELHAAGFTTIGFDSEEAIPFEEIGDFQRIALVLGSEGKGLRQKTRATCQHLAKLEMPGPIKSLNVSNATALALYLARQKLV